MIARIRRLVAAHRQAETHRYSLNFPEHIAREDDPYIKDLRAYKDRRRAAGTYYCDFGHAYHDDDCTAGPLEAHHDKIEFALMNGISYEILDREYPGLSSDGIGEWLNNDQNLTLLCAFHHRLAGGVHTLSHADWSAYRYVPGLVAKD